MKLITKVTDEMREAASNILDTDAEYALQAAIDTLPDVDLERLAANLDKAREILSTNTWGPYNVGGVLKAISKAQAELRKVLP